MKVIKIGKDLTIVLNSGDVITESNCTDELYNEVIQNQNDEEVVKKLLLPEQVKEEKKVELYKSLEEDLSNSSIISKHGDSYYIKGISEVSLPQGLIKSIIQAEKDSNQDLITTYKNFWTFCSCNPDSRARTNLFWFLKNYGMTIVKSGLFVAYRLVSIKQKSSAFSEEETKYITDINILRTTKIKKRKDQIFVGYTSGILKHWVNHRNIEKEDLNKKLSEEFSSCFGNLEEIEEKLSDNEVVYTDQRTKTMTIKLNQHVTIPRSDCDSVQENTCSNGLHSASYDWLIRNHCFGKVPMKVLINPSEVVAVPPRDDYGKLRTCGYYPIQILDVDGNGKLVDDNLISDGVEIDFIDILTSKLDINNLDEEKQTLEIPEVPELKKQVVFANIERIKVQLKERVINVKS